MRNISFSMSCKLVANVTAKITITKGHICQEVLIKMYREIFGLETMLKR